jgi:acyl-CoA reductase-like NAD-dependent aldehyde dehydrogenase
MRGLAAVSLRPRHPEQARVIRPSRASTSSTGSGGPRRARHDAVARGPPRHASSRLARSREDDCRFAIDRAHAFWTSLEWAKRGLAYRKHVVKNFSRLLRHFYEECLDELRQQTPKTRLEADKDFWEAKRAADHLEGNAEKAMRGRARADDAPRAGRTGRTRTSRRASARSSRR